MEDTAPPTTPAEPRKADNLRAAAWTGAVLVLGMAGVVYSLAHDKSRRSELESTAQLTAVGDRSYYTPPERSVPFFAIAQFKGKPLTPVSWRQIEIRDSRMSLAGHDDQRALRIYTPVDQIPWVEGEVEDKARPVYFVKIETNKYLRVQ